MNKENQEFYNRQVQEELNFMNRPDFVFNFLDLDNNQKGILIAFKDKSKNPILIAFKDNCIDINTFLAFFRLNFAYKEIKLQSGSKETSENSKIDITSSSDDFVTLKNKTKIIVSNGYDISFNGEPLIEDTTYLEERLLEFATVNEGNDDTYLDFYKARFDRGLQNYLLLSLYQDSLSLDNRLSNSMTYYKLKDIRFYHLINSFMRGNFDEMIEYLDTLEEKPNIAMIPMLCQNLIQSNEELPLRSRNIAIYRVGSGKTKNLDLGSENENLGFVSFGTHGGVATDVAEKHIIYRRVLRKDERAIPIDLIGNMGVLYLDGTLEDEILTMPFKFKIKGKTKSKIKYADVDSEINLDIYDIEKTEDIDARALLETRFFELIEYLRAHGDLRAQYLEKTKDYALSKKLQEKPKVKFFDIYVGLRPGDDKDYDDETPSSECTTNIDHDDDSLEIEE